ncbi:MAG: bifunctional phosphoglucose/phosphomannose isomerase [Chloroflexi bacterium]|nr:bifunctional phosphoglucose/phosphomannose isomerase [Chloroflexota bacterium]
MSDLDDLERIRAIDRSGLIRQISELGAQCRQAWAEALKLDLPASYRQVDAAVVMGMGGSAIGADLVRTAIAHLLPVPMLVCRDYRPPAFVGPKTLAIASSYSGATEETLSCFSEALQRGAKGLVITTGGPLLELAVRENIPAFHFRYQAPPRAALGYSFAPLLCFFSRLGLIPDHSAALEEAVNTVDDLVRRLAPEVPEAMNEAKQLARFIFGRWPIVYGAELLGEVARRWKGQFNENSKAWSAWEVMPELNHNAVVGYEFPKELTPHIAVLLLHSSHYHPKVQARLRATAGILERRGVAHRVVRAPGDGPLAQMLSTIALGDHASYYLAILNGRDPMPVEVIDELKAELAKN